MKHTLLCGVIVVVLTLKSIGRFTRTTTMPAPYLKYGCFSSQLNSSRDLKRVLDEYQWGAYQVCGREAI
jgi:hypothetical protein